MQKWMVTWKTRERQPPTTQACVWAWRTLIFSNSRLL